MDFKVSFTNTHQDLIDSYNAIRNFQSGLSGWSRGLIMLLGIMWLLGFIFLAPKADNLIQPLIWLCLGCFILWKVALKPHLEIKHIKDSNEPVLNLSIVFNDAYIVFSSDDERPFKRSWDEVEEFHGFKKGVFFSFSDGASSWIPLRAFASKKDKNHFEDRIIAKLNEYYPA